MKKTFILANDIARAGAVAYVKQAPQGYAVTISEANRTLEQNSAQWPILNAFADQLQWPVNGKLEWLTPEEWKDLLTAAFKRETVRVSPGLDGGMVMLGQKTSKFGKKEFSDWIDFLNATATARDVRIDYMEYA